jgi:outer membrane murein-binding lipoprotein Lpp
MDGATMKDYLEDLIKQVEQLEQDFHTLNAVIVQLQAERDAYRELALGVNRG